ncbi:MAG: MarC family protein [Deltaproteobacteria bacterium]|jgi:multiple antibiotic resistance protein
MKEFWLCFVPLFVAVDAFGVLPFYLSLTQSVPVFKRRDVLLQTLMTASAVSVAFLVGGPALMSLLGIAVSDFMVAGGILLFAISLMDLLTGEKRQRRVDVHTLGAVPLGVPLIAGPAVLTTSVLLANLYGLVLTGLALLINVGIAVTVFRFSNPINRLLGHAGLRIVSKIASLLLACIAVMLVRQGIVQIIERSIKAL